jgi:hypothetical protein
MPNIQVGAEDQSLFVAHEGSFYSYLQLAFTSGDRLLHPSGHNIKTRNAVVIGDLLNSGDTYRLEVDLSN